MSFTTPACPMAEMIQEMIKNTIAEIAPDFSLNLETTFDPMRSPSMIRDEDLKKMFDM
jgi:metal-sulfur cluster biosynthetic enzyme